MISLITLVLLLEKNSYSTNTNSKIITDGLNFESLKLKNYFDIKNYKRNRISDSPVTDFLSKNTILNTKHQKISKRNEYTNSRSISIANTFFCYCSSTSPGGAVYVNNKDSSLSLQKTIFLRCTSRSSQTIKERTEASGGALFSYSSTTSISYSCFDSCNSNKIGLAFYSQVVNDKEHVFNYLTISRSFSTTGKFTFCMDSGNAEVLGLNSTRNKATTASSGGFGSCPLPTTSQIRFCQFERNSGRSIFYLQTNEEPDYFSSSCNFINNTLHSDHLAVLCCSSGLSIKKFLFVDNTANLIYSLSKITLISCSTDQQTFGKCKFSLVNCKVSELNLEPSKIKFMEVC